MAEKSKLNPPYTSESVLKAFFDTMRNRRPPAQLQIKDLKAYGLNGAPGALQSTLKFLGLIDDEYKPTDKFKKIQAEGDLFKKNLKEIISSAYADLFGKHPLEHATYEGVVNYFKEVYSSASGRKMAKSFGVLCQYAGIESPAFSKMRSQSNKTVLKAVVKTKKNEAHQEAIEEESLKNGHRESPHEESPFSNETLVADFIKTNPIPQGVQWNADTLKTYFDQYRATIKMLRGEEKKD